MGYAKFHQWGTDYEELETGPGQYSTAIIELPDGEVENIPADMIEFVDSPDSMGAPVKDGKTHETQEYQMKRFKKVNKDDYGSCHSPDRTPCYFFHCKRNCETIFDNKGRSMTDICDGEKCIFVEKQKNT